MFLSHSHGRHFIVANSLSLCFHRLILANTSFLHFFLLSLSITFYLFSFSLPPDSCFHFLCAISQLTNLLLPIHSLHTFEATFQAPFPLCRFLSAHLLTSWCFHFSSPFLYPLHVPISSLNFLCRYLFVALCLSLFLRRSFTSVVFLLFCLSLYLCHHLLLAASSKPFSSRLLHPFPI